MPQIVKFALGFIIFIIAIWLLFYFTIFLFFVAIILVWIFYLKKIFEKIFPHFENFFNRKNNFKSEKKSSENSSHVKEKFFLDVDKEFDQDISDAEIKK